MSTNDSDHSLASKSAVAQEAPELPQGSTFDRYVVLEVLGKGGMGVVYKAYDPRLNRGVALKLMRTQQEGRGSDGSARLLREAQALGQLNHPNVVSVHDVGTVEDNVFMAMELVHGKTLKAWYKEIKPSTREVLELMRAAGQGLAAAHKQGLIHRDFKPDNVIVGEDGRVRVIDFGLARAGVTQPSAAIAPQRDIEDIEKIANTKNIEAIEEIEDIEASGTQFCDWKRPRADDASPPPSSSNSRDVLSAPLTRADVIVGTPIYMAPEQHSGAWLDACTDQFSFCVVLYEVLHGERPFSGRTRQEIAEAVLCGRVRPPPAESDVTPWLHNIVMRGLSRRPDERYPSMEALLEELREDPQEARRQQQAARRRKMLVLGSVALAVCGPIGAWYGSKYQAAQRCAAVETQLVGVWDGATKDAIRMAFLDTKKSFAAGTWERVERALDTYTAEWTHMHTEVCEATWLTGKQSEEVFDLRKRCLKKRIGELEALAKVFAGADAGVVQKAAEASSSLSGIAICADEEALRAPYPQPKTAEAKAKVAAIAEKLTGVEAFSKTGKYREGLELARKLEEEANAVAYRPVQAEALYWLGELLNKGGEYKEAETTLVAAARAAGDSRDGLLAARAMAKLVFVVGYRQARHKEATVFAQNAEVVLGLGGGDDALRSQLLSNMGVVFANQGEHDKALEYYRKTLAIREKVLGPEHPEVAHTLNNLGVEFWRQGENDKALTYYRKSLAIYEKVLGPEHPEVAGSLNNIGILLDDKGEFDKALEYHRKALAIKEEALGPEHPLVASSLNNMGGVFRVQGEHDKALEYYREGLAIREKALGPKHPLVASSLNNMGGVFSMQGEHDKALTYYRKSLAIYEKVLGPEHPKVAWLLSGIGNVFVDQERPQQAIGPLERALRLCKKKTCQPEPHGAGLFGLARALVATDGDTERAIELARQAREVFGGAPKAFTKELEEVNAWLQERGAE